jgi:L-xylulokinase
MSRYVLGLDAGNTVIKAVIFSLDGREIAMAAAEGHSKMAKPGHVERGLGELWRDAGKVISSCIRDAGISPDEIIAVGCAGHGNGLYALDRAGEPLIGIQSIDTRAANLVQKWAVEGKGSSYAISGQSSWPAQTPTLLAWLKLHEPELFARIGTVLLSKDFIVNRLTGEKVSDVSDMSGCGLLNLATRAYDRAIMASFGLEDSMDILPALHESDAIVGHVTASAVSATGLREGTPVVAGLFDVIASAVGSGVTETGSASIIVRTWSINQVITEEPILASPVFMTSTFDRQRFMAMENSATSATNLEWMVREFFPDAKSPFGLCSDLVAAVDPCDDVPIYHPFLYGANSYANARAGYYGLAGWHSRGHMLRALFEGVVFAHRQHIEILRKAGARFDQAVLSGGGSRSHVWAQMFADILGVPVATSGSQETGALGAAITAGTGVGAFASFAEGAGAMTRIIRIHQPNRDLADVFERRYRLFLDIGEAMRPVWQRMAEGNA